jgi:anti-anti-sigma factor
VERSSGAAPPRRFRGGARTALGTDDLLSVELDAAGEDISVVALSGELDLSTIPRLEPLLLEELGRRSAVIIDLTSLDFIDSSGIGLLIKARQADNGSGRLHTVVSPGSQVERVFTITGIGRVLPLFSARAEALAAVPGTGRRREG